MAIFTWVGKKMEIFLGVISDGIESVLGSVIVAIFACFIVFCAFTFLIGLLTVLGHIFK